MSLSGFAALLILATGYFTYAQVTATNRYVIGTVNVFPANVTTQGWENVGQIAIQNLQDDSLYQEFNTFNSAYIVREEHEEALDNLPEQETLTELETVPEEVDIASSTEEVVVDTEAATATTSTSGENIEPEPATVEEEVVEEGMVETPAENTPEEVVEPEPVEDESVSVRTRATELFDFAFASVTELLPFTQATETAQSTSSVEAQVEEEILVASEAEVTEEVALPQTQAATTSEEVVAPETVATTTPEEVTAETQQIEELVEVVVEEEGVTEEVASTTDEAATTTPVVATTTPEVTASTTVPTQPPVEDMCAGQTDCIPYVVTLSDFGLPIFDQTTRFGGGQFRMSFAAQSKDSNDVVQNLDIVYSLDKGDTWLSSGAVIIDEEASNSINGGFYLFSIPELSEADQLDDLQVQIRYDDNPLALEGIFIESAWMEVFTIQAPDKDDFDIDALMEDNGYEPGILSGDRLVLEDGSEIRFTHTDENTGETLIIKSDSRDYVGLSETTTYFSITNTSDRRDTVSVQAYFPDGVGEVVSLEQWNQNKEKEVIIPEYRPYAYHCEAGWEETSDAATESDEMIAALLRAAADFDFGEEESVTEETESVLDTASTTEFTDDTVVATTTEPIESSETEEVTGIEDVATTTNEVATTTTFNRTVTTELFAQATATSTGTTTEVVSTPVVEEDTLQNYVCPDTRIVRTCDYVDGDDTACVVEDTKVRDHVLTRYEGGWERRTVAPGERSPEQTFIDRVEDIFGLSPDTKPVPSSFEVRAHSQEQYTIEPGETLYFKMDISFPPFSNGEYWVEAIGEREYGLLDPFWSSDWSYRIPILIDNSNGTETLTEQQVFLELDSALSDFWSNVQPDGSDIRFIQEIQRGNLFSENGPQFENAYDQAWAGRVAVTIDAANIDSRLAEFPVYLNLADLGPAFWSGVQSDGRDIRITEADGATEVPVDVVEIDTVNETGELHFLATELDSGTDTTFHVYFDNPGATARASTSQFGAQSVWNNYEAVYHFEEDPNVGITDKTGNGFNLTTTVGTAATTSGQLGTALDTTSSSVLLEDTDWTWTAGDSLYSSGLYFQTAVDTGSIWQFSASCGGDNCLALMPWYDQTDRGFHRFGETSNNTFNFTRNNAIWHHFTSFGRAKQGQTVEYFEDNTLRGSYTQSASGEDPSQTGLQIGRYNAGAYMDIDIDELRFSTNEPSLAWVGAEYVNFSTSTDFYSTSTQPTGTTQLEGWYSTSWENRQKITLGPNIVTEQINEFPVYVDLATLGAAFFNDVAVDGGDIRMTLGDGTTEIPVEVVSINTGGQTGELYFKADITSSAEFYIYYNNEDANAYDRSDTYGSENVWTNNYRAVWHFDESAPGIGNSEVYLDSTANQFHGDDENSSNDTTGIVGNGIELGDGVGDHVDFPDEVLDGLGDISVSGFYKVPESASTADRMIMSAANASQPDEFMLWLDDDGSGPDEFIFEHSNGGEAWDFDNNGVWGDDQWDHFLVSGEDAIDEVNFYLNGLPDSENPDPQAIDILQVDNGGFVLGQNQSSVGNFSSANRFIGQLDEIRIASTTRNEAWAAAEYETLTSPTTFYATSSPESLSVTDFVELDFWLQYFSTTTDEADIWVQVEEIPAGESVTIWLYYGATGATSASDELATFTYSTSTEIFYVVDDAGANTITVQSLIDNNEVSIDGGTAVSLDSGESTTFTTFTGDSSVSVLGPISSTITNNTGDGSESLVPISFATTTFAIPTNRATNNFYAYAPFASTSVLGYVAAAGSPSASISVATGTAGTIVVDPADTGVGANGDGVVLEASDPILVMHRSSNPGDGLIAYPPTEKDIFGIYSRDVYISGLNTSTDIDVTCSNGSSGTANGVTRGDLETNTVCAVSDPADEEGQGAAVRLYNQDGPIAALQQADADGNESTVYWPQYEFGTQYHLTNSAAYAAVACSPRFGTTTLEVRDSLGTVLESGTCAPNATDPGKAYFNNGNDGDSVNFAAGAKIVSTNGVPFYVIYEDVSIDQDEKNVDGPVQSRKFGADEFVYVFGEQEIANDAQYTQESFRWYENGNNQTPTSTWPLGDGEFATEGVAITGTGAVENGDVLRLRMNLSVSNATGTESSAAFKLQYGSADAGQCSVATNWQDVGLVGSTTAAFSGFNNSAVGDGSELASTTLASTTVAGTYEERNISDTIPNEIGLSDVAEWDWVLEATNVEVNTNYCFRMVRETGRVLAGGYTLYPELETVGPPNTPTQFIYFDNERVNGFDSVLEFLTTDIAGDDIHYQVQIDEDFNFGTPDVDRNSEDNFLDFENISTPSDKAPFTSGAQIRFTSPTTLSATSTYWFRVRASDPDGSATSSAWSAPTSFTTDGSIVVTEWYQTTDEQFDTNSLTDVSASGGSVSLTGTEGTIVSTGIDFDNATVGNAWGEIEWTETETSGSFDVQVQYNDNGVWQLVPDTVIPNNAVGNGTSPINILEMDPRVYNEIRLVGNFTGTTVSLQEWTVRWGQRVEIPTLGDLFDNEAMADTTPVFDMVSTDPQGDDLQYEISFSTDNTFVTGSSTFNSATAPGFSATSYTSGATAFYTVQPGDAFTDGETYWWRARARDPLGGNAFSPWSDPDTFTVSSTISVSTWYQTTQEQFDEGILDGLAASSSDSVVIEEDIGEYGTVTITNNTWQTVTTTRSYNNMVVVGSPEYDFNGGLNGRTVRVRNKTSNTFEIKVDNYLGTFSGSTPVDYIVMEAGDWDIDDGGSGFRVVAATESGVTEKQTNPYVDGVSRLVSYPSPFSSAPSALATISSDNDSDWIGVHVDGGDYDASVTSSQIGLALAASKDTTSTHSGGEDIDYIVFEASTGTNNGVAFDADDSPDVVNGDGPGETVTISGFSGAPAVTVVQNNGDDGLEGGFALKDTGGTQNASTLTLSIAEQGATADGHIENVVSFWAFENSSGIIARQNSGSLTGTIRSEDIIFSDGAGPKFDNFSFVDQTPGGSSINYQFEYLVSEGVYALIPDTEITGNSSGFTSGPVDLTNVDINIYDTIRVLATFTCSGGSCPELEEWKVEWSEGVNMSGTLREYDRTTTVATGTIRAAVNGSLLGSTGSFIGSVWTLNNVTAFAGDIVTVWVDGATEAEEAVTVFEYDGLGDITGVALYEQHLAIDADEEGTLTNLLMGSYDNSVSGNEDIFFDVDGSGNLDVCATGTCSDANLYIGPGQTYTPATTTPTTIETHDFVNDGTIELDNNTIEVSGSWDNNATSSTDTSTVVMTASTTDESITSTESPLDFHNLTFGGGVGTSTFTISDNLDLSGNLSVVSGTLARDGYDITLEGSLNTTALGFWDGTGTTTFDGGGSVTWTDAHASTSLQNIGNVFIDGASKIVTVNSDVSAFDITIGSDDLLSGGGSNTLYVGGDWTNNGTFQAQTSTVEFVNDDRTYAPPIPGTSGWYGDTSYLNRIAITIDDGEVPGDLSNFPVFVDLSTLGSTFWANVNIDGGDIRVTEGDGQTEVPLDVVEINTTTESGEVHFLADSVLSATSTSFYIYFNNATSTLYAPTDTYGSQAVWAGYEAVYHFSDDDFTIGSVVADASPNGRDLTVLGENLATTTGQLGTALNSSSTVGYLLDFDFIWTSGEALYTSGWYFMDAFDNETVWEWGTGNNPDDLEFRPWNSATGGLFYFGDGSGATYAISPRTPSVWRHFTTIGNPTNGANNFVYEDAVLVETDDQDDNNPFHLDGLRVAGNAGSGFNGYIDELRIASTTQTSDWIEAEFTNQSDVTSFYATSSVETYSPELVLDAPSHNITSGGSAFFNLVFNDATTSAAFLDPSIVANGDFTIATGTIAMPTGKLTVGGSFFNNGIFMHNNAEVEFNSSGAETIQLLGTPFFNAFFDVTFDGSGTFTFTDTNATTSNDFVIEEGTVVFPSGDLTIGGTLTNNGGSFNANGGTVKFLSTDNENVTTDGSSFNNVEFGDTVNTSGWLDSAWQGRMRVAIASTSVTGVHMDFPVYVNLADFDSTFWSGVASDGRDVRVTVSDGTSQVPVEVVEIDTSAETGEMHFLAPILYDSIDTVFYVYYNNDDAVAPTVDSAFGRNAVWSQFEAVYHFSEDPTQGITDVTGKGKDLIPAVGTPSTTPGILGTALDTTTSNVMMADADWAWPAGEDLVTSGLYFMDNNDTGALWQWGSACPGDNCIAFMPWYSDATEGFHRFGETSGNDYDFARDNSVWHHFVTNGRATAGELVTIHEDNVLRDNYLQTTSGADPTQTGLQIGRYTGGTYMDIDIDELRIGTTTRSNDWIETEFNNLRNVASFYNTSNESYISIAPSFTLDEATTDADGDVSVFFANLVAPTDTFTIGGSAQNTGGTYDPNNATTTFDSTTLGQTVDFGDVDFFNLAFDGVGGGWTIATTTVTNNATLLNGASFTLSTSTTMTVGGVFTNAMNAAATNWTNSTLVLTGGDYTVTDRLEAGDAYATIEVSNDTDIVIWNSSISTSTIRDTSSLYMPDHAGVDGELRIFGDYARTSGTEYWSYTTDFDGTDLTGGSERQATVLIDLGSRVSFGTSTTLQVRGVTGATSTVSSLAGAYTLVANNATVDFEYASFADTGKAGVELRDGTAVTALTNTVFDIAPGRSGLTVDAATINAGPSAEYSNVRFATTTGGSVYEAEWSDSVFVTIQSSQIEETLTDYVVFVDLSTLGSDFWSGVTADGRDVRVTDDAGNELPIDLVEINTAAETGELHFLAPELLASEDTNFFIHFNNPSAVAYDVADEFGANAVWTGYEAVYHFNEDPTVRITDMTGNGRDLLPTVGSMATTTGLIGTALDTTGTNAVLQSLGWTWEAGDDLISTGLYFQSAVDDGALWQFGTTCGGDNCLALMPWFDSVDRGYHRFGENSGNDFRFTRNNTIWHHFTSIGRAGDGELVQYYEDTVLRDTYTQSPTGVDPSQTGLQVGRYNTGQYVDMEIDELRFSSTTISESRLESEYTNFTAPTTFYATSSAPSDIFNVTADGTPTTFWLFSNGTGNLYGEAFDNDDGDPGSIQWDDSNFAISISGVVYSDDGVTPMGAPVCNNSTEVVTVVLDGVTPYTTSCDSVDGSYSIEGIVYTGEPQVTAYIESSALTPQVNVGVLAETTGTGVTAGNTMTVARPAVIDNSVLVLIAGKDDNDDVVAPGDWTELTQQVDASGDDITTGIWYKVVSDAGTEAATYNFTGTDNGEEFSYWMGSLVNVDTVTPVDAGGTFTYNINDATPGAADITTVTNGALVLSAWYVFNDTEVVPPIFEQDVRADNVVGSINNLTVTSKVQTAAGATGTTTLYSVIDARESHSGQFAFRPAATPTATGSVTAAVVSKTPLGNTSPFEVVEQRDQRIGFGSVTAGSDIVLDRPAVENGDMLIAIVGKEDQFSVSPPAGWLTGAVRGETTGNDMYTGVWYKAVTNAGSEPTTYAFTNTDTGTQEFSYWIASFDGVDPVDVFDGTPAWSNLQNTSAPTAPSITTTVDGAYAIASWYVIDDGAMDMPGGVWDTLAQDIEFNNRLLAVAGRSMTTAGATTNATLTGGSTDDVQVIQFALNPAAVSVASAVTDFDIYQDYVIARHENIAPLTIADMAIYDNDDEADLPFVADTLATPDDLAVLNGTGLYVWNDKTFAPNGTLDLQGLGSTAADGTLVIGSGATYTSSSTYAITVGGSFRGDTGATFSGAQSPVTFTATNPGQQISSAASSTFTFESVDFTGVGGGWAVQTPILSLSGITVATGTLSGVADITVDTGSFAGNGSVDLTGGTTRINRNNTLGGTQSWAFNNLTLGDGVNPDITVPASTATTTVRGVLTIATSHFLDADNSRWNLSGTGSSFVENGTFLEDTSYVQYSGALQNVLRTTYYDLAVDTATGTASVIAPITSLAVLNDLTVGQTGTSSLNLNANDPALSVGGDIVIGDFGTVLASDSSLLEGFGSWTNTGDFTANGGTVEMKAATGTFTIAAGLSSFANLSLLNGASYTMTEHATATEDLIIDVGGFTLASGQRLAVGGTFTNTGSFTDWTNTTLYLYGGQAYDVNSKTQDDSYATVIIDGGTQPRTWNSSFSTTTLLASSSLYSRDHDDVAGDLYIFGDYRNDTYDDFWSYAQDWDGDVLGAPRTAEVYIEDGGTVTYVDGSLGVIGSSTASTTIQNQGSGTYALTVGGTASTSWQYAVPRDINTDGIVFTGSMNIDLFDNLDLLVTADSAQMITVGGTVIDNNPARNFDRNAFNQTGGLTGSFNVTATGTSVSSWRFTNHIGNYDGESFDNDGGDPGEIVWIDSAALITIAGNIYSDEGVTASAACDGATNNVRIVVAGLTTFDTTCAAGTGAYSVPNVGFGPTDSIVVYLNTGGGATGATVTADPISNILNMDVYEDRVIVRHESADPLRIEDLAPWDSSNDPDVPFTAVDAATDTLTLPADTKLIVWTNKEFEPNGDVTISGGGGGAALDGTLELFTGAEWTSVGSEELSVGGSMVLGAGATFDAGISTTTFTTTGAGRVIDVNEDAFFNVQFTGSGSWSITDSIFTANDVFITGGTLTLPTGTSTISGSFDTNGGAFTNNGSPMVFDAASGSHTVRGDGSDFAQMLFTGAGSWSMTDTDATSTESVTIVDGSLTLPTGSLAVGESFRNVGGTVTSGGSELVFTGNTAQTLLAGGSTLGGARFVGTGPYVIEDGSVTFTEDFTVANGSVTAATGTLTVGGSFDATGGVFDNATGTVLFNSGTLGQTIDPGTNDFYNLQIGGVGGFTIAADATTTNNFTLASAGNFVQQSGTQLYIGGVFTNTANGANTTWTNTELILDGNAMYDINTKLSGADTYGTLTVATGTDVRLWNSDADTFNVTASSSVYSQDHAGVDGALNIYGAFNIAVGTEYWNYTTDFDGTALGGSPRAVTVTFATTSSSSLTMVGGTLQMLGNAAGTTTVQSAGGGYYAFSVAGGTLNASEYAFTDQDINGLNISGTPSITSLSDGSFTQSQDAASSITLTSTALNTNASLLITGADFDNGGFLSGVNVNLDATTTNSWNFTGHTGNLSGEVYDIDGTDDCSSIRWDDSACLLTEQTDYRWRNDDGGEGAINSTWYDTNWGARQRIRVVNPDASTYTNLAVRLDVQYDADMQTDFDDLRFTSNDGVTLIPYWIEDFTVGTDAEIWVQVPSLTGDDVTEIFMYYDEVTATTTSSSTATFAIIDDFEDGDISEYAGDTSLFTVDGSFAYGGANGLDTTGFESNRANDGIFTFDQTVAQGDIIRYRQYIDTSAGANDEACTLFGIQATGVPAGSDNENYGVCLELFGTDRMTLARDVESTDTFGGVTSLSSVNVSYSTGWYEVTVDWQTDDTIDVTLRNAAGSVVATTSATDATYTSGGFGFTYWGFNGGWDSFTAQDRTDSVPRVYFGAEQGRNGATWAAAQNTPTGGFLFGETARLRVGVENSGLDIENQNFQLEFAPKLTAPSCEAVSSGSYTAVPPQASCGSSAVCMTASTTLTNGAATTDHLVVGDFDFVAGEIVTDPDNETGNIDINQNEYTELEYALTLTANAVNDAYCFRVTDSGAELDSYASVAELTLAFDPTVDTVTFNGGFDIVLSPGATTTVLATTTVTDLNGFADLVAATSTFYTTTAGPSCTADDNNCYINNTAGSCSFTNCTGVSCVLSCSADIFYHADPTDVNGDDWVAFIEVEDAAGGFGFNSSGGIDLLTLRAIDVDDEIAYGQVGTNSDTGSFNPSTTIVNQGNESIDVEISGTDLTDGAVSIIEVNNQRFSTSTFTYSSCTVCLTLNATSTALEVDLDKPTTAAPPVQDEIYWGIFVPLGINSAPHSGQNTFMAIGD